VSSDDSKKLTLTCGGLKYSNSKQNVGKLELNDSFYFRIYLLILAPIELLVKNKKLSNLMKII